MGISQIVHQSIRDTFGEFFKELQKRDAESVAALEKEGWFWSPALFEVPNIHQYSVHEAIEQYLSGNKDALYLFVKNSFEQDNYQLLDSRVAIWLNNNYFLNRKAQLQQAVAAHKRGEFETSIPLFLIAAEGIAGEYCDKRTIYVRTTNQGKTLRVLVKSDSNKGDLKLIAALDEVYIRNGFLHTEACVTLLNNLIYIHTSKLGKTIDQSLNRHGILHGNIVNYGSEENSYRCILLLDLLSFLN